MSRCFPFPPPGYEKNAITDNVDVLRNDDVDVLRNEDVDLPKKEKHREKKHKKEKKDKEKRGDKDKKEKDKSDGKHRDKKDRKERSKEKKDKEREKDTEKASTSLEKKISAPVGSCNGDHKLNHSEKEVKDQHITSNEKKQNTPFRGYVGDKPVEKFNEGAMDKFRLDLCNRINDEGKGSASQSTERSPFTGRTNHDRMVRNENGIIPMEKEKRKEARADDIRKMEGLGVTVGAAISATRPSTLEQNIVGKEKIENKGANVSEGLTSKKKNFSEGFQKRAEQIPRISASPLAQNIVGKEKTQNGVLTSGGFYTRVDGSPGISDKSVEPRQKNHKKEGEDKRGSKRKDKDKEKKSHGKDKEREKEKKKEEKAMEKNSQNIKDHVQIKDNVKNGLVVNQNIKFSIPVPDRNRNLVPDGKRNLLVAPKPKLPQLVPDGDRGPVVDGNLKKRKEIEANGFLHETCFVANKKPRPTPHPSIENGRKLGPGQAPAQQTPDRKVLPSNNLIKVENNEHKANGKIEAQSFSISLRKPSPSPSPSPSSSSSSRVKGDQVVQAPAVKPCHPGITDQIAPAPMVKPPHPGSKPSLPASSSRTKSDQIPQAPVVKPPHRDTKYLSKVLSVPKIEESFEFDDEEWLFSNKNRVPVSAEASETPIVWDKAVEIETADVYALPYVIPY